MCHFTNKGFTLAELLAVVIILGLLTTFSVGYYRKSTDQARFSEVLATANQKAEQINQDLLELAIQGETITYSDTQAAVVEQCEITNKSGCTSIYAIEVLSDYVETLPKGRITCIGLDGVNGSGRAFCETMGFQTCTADGAQARCLRKRPTSNN